MHDIEERKTQKALLLSWFYIFVPMWMITFQESKESTVKGVLRALFEHPAVSSLGCDLILCALSFGIWTLASRSRNVADARTDEKVEKSG